MDLIEVLWKQDVDLGFSPENATPKPEKLEIDKKDPNENTEKSEDVEKLKALQAINEDSIKVGSYVLRFFSLNMRFPFSKNRTKMKTHGRV